MATETRVTRRGLLGMGHRPRAERAVERRMVFRPQEGPAGDVLVCVFLRGGADGLHLVAPVGDAHYAKQRPRIAVRRPDDTTTEAGRRGVELDGFFALHPTLAPLKEPYRAGRLAVVHAVGSPDQTHSHFEAMATMERGVSDGSTAASGWLGRHFQETGGSMPSPLRAVAIGDTLPASLEGAMGATAVQSLAEFRLGVPAGWSNSYRATLAGLYAGYADELGTAGKETFRLLRALERLEPERYRAAGGIQYPDSDFGRGLAQVAQLVRAEVGLEAACVDLDGWDSHFGQDTVLEGLMTDLAGGLAAFDADLGERMDRVTVVVMSEFGRRVHENGGLGTDHGQATCFWLMGGGIKGGRVVANWPGLEDHQLDGPGDLKATIDYRDLLAEVVAKRLRNPAWQAVFPGYVPRFRGVCV
jgi:uncharacterized protein (DUF1501 family)